MAEKGRAGLRMLRSDSQTVQEAQTAAKRAYTRQADPPAQLGPLLPTGPRRGGGAAGLWVLPEGGSELPGSSEEAENDSGLLNGASAVAWAAAGSAAASIARGGRPSDGPPPPPAQHPAAHREAPSGSAGGLATDHGDADMPDAEADVDDALRRLRDHLRRGSGGAAAPTPGGAAAGAAAGGGGAHMPDAQQMSPEQAQRMALKRAAAGLPPLPPVLRLPPPDGADVDMLDVEPPGLLPEDSTAAEQAAAEPAAAACGRSPVGVPPLPPRRRPPTRQWNPCVPAGQQPLYEVQNVCGEG